MEFYEKFDLEALKEDLQKKLRITDWDIDLQIVNGLQMHQMDEKPTIFGLCEKWRQNKEAIIYLNKDTRDESNFFETFMHEMIHVATDDFCLAAGEVCDLIKDDDFHEMQTDHLTLEYERQTESLAKSFCICLGYDYIYNFLKAGDDDGEDEEPVRRKRGKNTVY